MSWYKKLLVEEATEEFRNNLYEELKGRFKEFFATYNSQDCVQNAEELNDWYSSEVGQKELLRLVQDFWKLLKETVPNAMPAHDARHAIYKVPTFSLKYMESEGVTGYERVGLISALGHDFGRWSEERLFGNAGTSAIHSRMSFVLVEEFLSNYRIPTILKKEILSGVIRHTTGGEESDGMVLKLVVSPDRDQLIGPEIILRLSHHKANADSLQSFFGEAGDVGILEKLTKYYFIRFPGPLYSLDDVKELYRILHTFCFMALGEEQMESYISTYNNHSLLHMGEDKKYAQAISAQYTPNLCPVEAFSKLLAASNVAPNMLYKQMALDKLLYTQDSEKRYNLARALMWVNTERERLDRNQYEDLERIATNCSDEWIKWIAKEIQKDWFK